MRRPFLNCSNFFRMLLLCAGLLAPVGLAAQNTSVVSDAHRLKAGVFSYRTLEHGKEEGRSRIVIRKEEATGNVVFSTDITGAFDQRWESVATADFRPVSASLSFGGDAGRRLSFDLKYADGRVTGFAAAHKSSAARTIDDAVPPDAVDQRIDWAAALAGDLKPGSTFRFSVYDPWIGLSKVVARVGPLEHIQVPAGSFDAYRVIYRVEKNTGAETYQVLASKEIPRMMIREDFPDGASAELVHVEPE
jgi:hypothetical protein